MENIRLAIPKSTKQLLVFLEATKRVTRTGDFARFKRSVGVDLDLVQPWLNRSLNTVSPFRTAYSSLKLTYQERTRASQLTADAGSQLSYTVRDFATGLQRRVRRNGEDPVVLTYYRVPSESLTPKASTPEEWREIAANLLEGETLATTQGHPAMANPSAEDLERSIADFDLHSGNLRAADAVYQQAQQQMETLRDQALLIWRGIAKNLRLLLADQEPSAQRRFLRNFGFVFRTEGEQVESTEDSSEPENPDDSSQPPVIAAVA
jgi:hypothetical protein